jgi:hypothetical protein
MEKWQKPRGQPVLVQLERQAGVGVLEGARSKVSSWMWTWSCGQTSGLPASS